MNTPSFTDGQRGIKDPTLSNLNVLVSSSPLAYIFIEHSLARQGRTIDHEGADDVHQGSDTRSKGVKKGGITLQLNKATDTAADVAHVLKLVLGSRTEFYVVTEAPEPETRNATKRQSVSATQVVNPFFQGLLSEDLGDTKQQTFSKAAGDTTIDPVPVNHRTGATKAYSATQADGSALPTGLAINASTGVLSITAASISTGTYTIKVVATDTLSTLPSDHPLREISGEGTLILTVTS